MTNTSTTNSSPINSSLVLAHWLDRRLDLTLGFHLPAVRLYGIVVNDPSRLGAATCLDGDGARLSFIEEGRDGYDLLAGSAGVLARSFDAAAIVTTGWAAPMQADGAMEHRPSRHPQRRRVRVVVVVDDEGLSSVTRFEDDPTHPVGEPFRGVGLIADAMEEMWFGVPNEFVNVRTTRGGCTRRP